MVVIASDIATARQRKALIEAHPDTLTSEHDFAAWDDRLSMLRAEFEAAFFVNTGVLWDIANRVMN